MPLLGADVMTGGEDATQILTGATSLPPVSVTTWQHVNVSLLWFALSAQWMTVVPIIVPDQVAVILGGDSAAKEAISGTILAAGAVVALVVAPLSGALSDRSQHRRGRRRLFLIAGVLGSCIGLLLLLPFGPGASLWLYAAAFIFLQFWWNWVAGAYAGLIPDVVAEHEQGRASAWLNIMSVAGAVAGNVVIVATYQTGHFLRGFFIRQDFIFDAEKDHYTCPAGTNLTRGPARSDRKHLTACFTCPLKPKCTPDKLKRVKRWQHEGVLDKMQAKLDQLPDAMSIRRQTVKHPFGTLKPWMGSTQFLTKTLEKVRTEMSLHVLRHRRTLTISRIELREIAGNALTDLFETSLHLALGDVLVMVVHRLALPAVRPFNKALHPIPRKSCGNHIARITSNGAFSHSLDP